MAVGQKLYGDDDFERFISLPENSERRFELINGKIVEKVPTEEPGVIIVNCVVSIGAYVEQHSWGRLAVSARCRPNGDVNNDRLPDISFTSAERALPLVKKGAVPQLPDFIVEVKTSGDSYKSLREKAEYYLANGSRMVWLVYPDKRLIEVYLPNQAMMLFTENDMLYGGDVLPGFTLPVSQVFAL